MVLLSRDISSRSRVSMMFMPHFLSFSIPAAVAGPQPATFVLSLVAPVLFAGDIIPVLRARRDPGLAPLRFDTHPATARRHRLAPATQADPAAAATCAPAPACAASAGSLHDCPRAAPPAPAVPRTPRGGCSADNRAARRQTSLASPSPRR